MFHVERSYVILLEYSFADKETCSGKKKWLKF